MKQYWLVKSEPDVWSIDQQKNCGSKGAVWDGVRNYQARNFLRKMAKDDLAFFYHSNTKVPGIVGLVKIIKSNVIDPTQFDENSEYYDAKATIDNPRWQTVIIEFVEIFPDIISLTELKREFTAEDIIVVKKGNRLSVMPVENAIAKKILERAKS